MGYDPGIDKWYEDKRKEADAAHEALEKAKADGAPPKEIRRLEDVLERARYVGD